MVINKKYTSAASSSTGTSRHKIRYSIGWILEDRLWFERGWWAGLARLVGFDKLWRDTDQGKEQN